MPHLSRMLWEERNKTVMALNVISRKLALAKFSDKLSQCKEQLERLYQLEPSQRLDYNLDTYYFEFKPCDTPNLVARHSCILSYPSLLSSVEKQALQALVQPIIFGEKLADRGQCHYQPKPEAIMKNCLNLKQVTLGLVHERDCWRNQFFSYNYKNYPKLIAISFPMSLHIMLA